MPQIDVCLSPELYKLCDQDNSIVVVIDILRATSAICTAFEFGVEKVIPVDSVDKAQDYKSKGYLVGAERDGQMLEGFDFGNSPYSYTDPRIKNQTVVITTTNGTRAIELAKNNHMVVVGAFTNISALCEWLSEQNKDILLLCSGWKGRINLEDSMFAGAVVDRLFEDPHFDESYSDAALAARHLFLLAEEDPQVFLRNSSHRQRLSNLNLKEDIKYSLQVDKTDIIPVLRDGVLERLEVEKPKQS
jgi:2-phosphosulfolactate phosphatase